MDQKAESVAATLQAIRKLMSSDVSSKEDILELTEDDLVDEQDADAYFADRFDNTSEKFHAVNENLTQIPHSLNKQDSQNFSSESLVSDENAVKSTAAIKDLIKKVEQPIASSKATTLEAAAMEAIKPFLKDWLNEHLPAIVRQVVEQEIKKLIPKKDEDR